MAVTTSKIKEKFDQLKAPFHPDDIEWRVQRVGKTQRGPWAMVLAYITARAIHDRLDEVFGPENWQNQFHYGPNGEVLCGISIKVGDEWITKWDGAQATDIEPVKGGLSGAMKRAGVPWGIGRYLYKLTDNFAKVVTHKTPHRHNATQADKQKGIESFYWEPPDLPEWALPAGYKKGQGKKAPPAPDDVTPPEPDKKPEGKGKYDELCDVLIATMRSAKDMETLASVWSSIQDKVRENPDIAADGRLEKMTDIKDDLKQKFK